MDLYQFAQLFNLMCQANRFPLLKSPTLELNNNCHSSTIKAHYDSLSLDLYSIIYHNGNDTTDLPKLVDNGVTYRGVELNRQLFNKLGHTNVPEEKLVEMITNDHRNCVSKYCKYAYH